MNELWLLKIECPVSGIVSINGEIAGETPNTSLCHYVGEKRVYLSFAPVCGDDKRLYIGFSRIITLSYETPAVTADDGTLSLYIFPGSVCFVRIRPPFILLPQTPYTLVSLDFSAATTVGHYHAEVYFEFSFQFALSDSSGRILLVCPLPAGLKSARLFTHEMNARPYVFTETVTEKETLLLVCVDISSSTLMFMEECESYRFEKDTVEIVSDVGDPYGHRLFSHCTFTADGLIYRHTFRHHSESSQEPSPALTPAAFALAVKYQNAEVALSYLSPSLKKEVSFEDLRDFFGEIGSVETAMARPGELALAAPAEKNTFYVRLFSIEFSDNQISNITEQE